MNNKETDENLEKVYRNARKVLEIVRKNENKTKEGEEIKNGYYNK